MESGRPLPRSAPRDGRGGWRAALFIIVVGLFERVGFIGVQGNLITYLSGPLGMSTAVAAAGANVWSGTVLVLPLVGALAADSRLGRYRAVLLAGALYLLGNEQRRSQDRNTNSEQINCRFSIQAPEFLTQQFMLNQPRIRGLPTITATTQSIDSILLGLKGRGSPWAATVGARGGRRSGWLLTMNKKQRRRPGQIRSMGSREEDRGRSGSWVPQQTPQPSPPCSPISTTLSAFSSRAR